MTLTGSVPRLASAAPGGAATSDAEADLLMAMHRKRAAEEMLRERFMPAWAVAAAAIGGSLMTALILLLMGAS